MYYFYIVRCSDNSLYCGQTNNLRRRLEEHNSKTAKSAKYLRGKTPVKLVYQEKYQTLQEAMKREWQVKQWKKSKKEALVKRNYFYKLLRYAAIIGNAVYILNRSIGSFKNKKSG